MFEFLRRLFKKPAPPPEPGSLVEEIWSAELSGERKGRFLEVRAEGYNSSYSGGILELALDRSDLFAWTEAALYRYADLVIEGEMEFAPGSPYSACGLLFRYQDSGNFYSVLVSDKNFFRLDVVFNGSPRPLVAWTELPTPLSRIEGGGLAFSLRLIARGGHYTVIVDEAWAAEAVDDSFRRGHVAFAGQRYGEAASPSATLDPTLDPTLAGGAPAVFRLHSCHIESRPLEVETLYYRWNYYIVPGDAARRRLAETFFSMGEYLAGAIELRKLERRRALDPDELFLKAELALRLDLREEAGAALDACLAASPGRPDAAEEKANLLYLQGRSVELRDWLAELLPRMPGNERLLALSGHARFSLGDYLGAAEDYRKAADMDLNQALFRMNEARAWDQARRKAEAADAYLRAARLFFAQEADEDLALALGRLSALRPRSPEVKEIRAKNLYRLGKREDAFKLLSELAAKGSEDSAVHYLLGLILVSKGQRSKALVFFERALALEPDYALYAFRYAESLFLLQEGGRPGAVAASAPAMAPAVAPAASRAITRALELDPEDGWIMNLAGQAALAEGRLEDARPFLESAVAALPGSPEPAWNLAELELKEGRFDAALALLEPFPSQAACRNQAGNALALAGRLEEAAREYERAVALDPASVAHLDNLAATYIELERYSDAEARLRLALDLGPGPRSYLLAGNLGLVYGDRARAEASFRTGLALAPEDPPLLMALGRCYVSARSFKKAEDIRMRLEAADGGRAAKLASEIEEASTEAISCDSCGRTWRLPRTIPSQGGSSIRAMPPDESPAGACPRCGKVYCIACRKEALVDSRFTCPDCGEALKLSDDRLKWLVREHLRLRGGP
jgi:tetratricopeptide (TPR) repeat protein/predicted RNA-binding Zn-ribbon protein involved in translation (DUF1610 family)